MKIYSCDVCNRLVYFENTHCVNCGSALGYLPILDNMSSIESVDQNFWKALAPQAQGALFKKCKNYSKSNVCNWMIPQHAIDEFCISCSLNETIPNVNYPNFLNYWRRLEIAKRRLVYSLLRLNLPINSKKSNPEFGLSFVFLADEEKEKGKEAKKVMTGHNKGTITLNIAEADDAIREKMRLDMNERYRTLLGHFRHEIGHYYWSVLIEKNPNLLSRFREIFGDEQVNYSDSLKKYYARKDKESWQVNFVSSYASSHPWEDWAESWAHYLHMFDTLETARSWGLTVKFNNGGTLQEINLEHHLLSFEGMRDQWLYLSSALNSLNRSMGMRDVYPFVWTEAVIKKIRFVQEVIIETSRQW